MTALDPTASPATVLRPLMHFTPDRHWMNDPNGLLFRGGRYHLFFQHNPRGIDHADISWGHASSTDLVHWTQHPVAISFDEQEQIFSGSAVVDESNSSGFGVGGAAPIVAIYTSARSNGIQAQSLAYSLDEGETWQKYSGNPVLDRGSENFRDPKVFRYRGAAGDYWVMVAVEAERQEVLLYRSDDLKDWTFLSTYGPAGAVGGVWECPDLFPLVLDGEPGNIRWVLLISLNPGGLAGGSGTQYVVGHFDGVRFTPERETRLFDRDDPDLAAVDWLDAGRDCYAGVTFNGLPDEERVLVAWMSNWDYARALPTTPWRGSMTMARKLSLATVDGRPQLRAEPITGDGEVILRRDDERVGDASEVLALPPAARIDVRLRGDGDLALEISDGMASATIRLDPETRTIALDRTRADAGVRAEGFAGVERAWLPENVVGVLTIVVDHGSLEIFAADGLRCLTDLVFLAAERTLTLSSTRGAEIERMEIAELTGGVHDRRSTSIRPHRERSLPGVPSQRIART